MSLPERRRYEGTRPFEQMEVALVRALVDRSPWLTPTQVASLRYALNLARLDAVPGPRGDVDLLGALDEYRLRVREALEPLILETSGVLEHAQIRNTLPMLHLLTERARTALLRRFVNDFGVEHLDREICHKALVTVAGGGGGSGYVYAGAFKLLDDLGLVPRLIVGTSMGALIGLFRARTLQVEMDELLLLASKLRWRDVFLLPRVRNRYGVPASLRLYLRRTIANFFQHPTEGRALWLEELPVPLRVVVAGIRTEGLTRDMDYYEHLMDEVVTQEHPALSALRRQVGGLMEAVGDFIRHPANVTEIVLGGDPLTAEFDAVDAVGFSSAVPGIIHYDILREDPHMHRLMGRLFEEQGIARLIDGGVINNVPSRVAWREVQRGAIGTRNVFILGMDCFGPQLARNLLLHPIQRLVRPQVTANAAYASYTKTFRQVLSPLELVPDAKKLSTAIRNGYRELGQDRRFIREMMEPLPGLNLEYAT